MVFLSRLGDNVGVESFRTGQNERLVSRIGFYLVVFSSAWMLEQLLPSSAELIAEQDRRLGVSPVLVGASPEEVAAFLSAN